MRARQFQPSVGLLESRISLSGISGTTGASGAAMYQTDYSYSSCDGPGGSLGDLDTFGSNVIIDVPSAYTNALNGITVDSVIN